MCHAVQDKKEANNGQQESGKSSWLVANSADMMIAIAHQGVAP